MYKIKFCREPADTVNRKLRGSFYLTFNSLEELVKFWVNNSKNLRMCNLYSSLTSNERAIF